MKIRVKVTVKGNITRPFYTGYVTVCVERFEDVPTRVYYKLLRSSFPEIRKADIKVHSMEVINR